MRIDRLDAAEWTRLRAVRLRALDDEPDAFGASAEETRAQDEAAWGRFAAIGPWWIAVDADGPGRDVGLVAAACHDGDETARVYSMWVEPAWRGRGVADALLDAVRAFARSTGAVRISLDVTDRVPRARRFYERYGFRATGASEPLRRDPTIELTELVLELTPRRP